MLLGFPGLGFANEPAPRDWQPVRGPAPATSLDLWEGKGLLARSLDGGLWIREEGRDWRSLGNLGIHLSVELSGDEDQWLDMEALLEEELDISEGIAGGEEENALVEPDAVAEVCVPRSILDSACWTSPLAISLVLLKWWSAMFQIADQNRGLDHIGGCVMRRGGDGGGERAMQCKCGTVIQHPSTRSISLSL